MPKSCPKKCQLTPFHQGQQRIEGGVNLPSAVRRAFAETRTNVRVFLHGRRAGDRAECHRRRPLFFLLSNFGNGCLLLLLASSPPAPTSRMKSSCNGGDRGNNSWHVFPSHPFPPTNEAGVRMGYARKRLMSRFKNFFCIPDCNHNWECQTLFNLA